jgi:hypothetical protein
MITILIVLAAIYLVSVGAIGNWLSEDERVFEYGFVNDVPDMLYFPLCYFTALIWPIAVIILGIRVVIDSSNE